MFKAIVGMLVRKGRTKRGEGAWYGARLVPSRISHQIFFSRLELSCRTSTFRTTSILLRDVNSFSQLQHFFTTLTFLHDFNFFSTNSTFPHDFNFLARLQLFSRLSVFSQLYDFNTSTFQHDLNIPMSKWIWTP